MTENEKMLIALSLSSLPRKGWKKEDHFQACIVDLLRSRGCFIGLFNGNAHNRLTGAKNKAMGFEKGTPDIFVLHNDKSCFLEFKTDTGTLSKEQKEVIEKLVIRHNQTVYIMKGYQSAIDFFDMFFEK